MKTVTIKHNEMPEGKKKFRVLRVDNSNRLILEEYTFNEFDTWVNEIVGEFSLGYVFDKKEFLKKVKYYIPKGEILYIEEGTFIDPAKN